VSDDVAFDEAVLVGPPPRRLSSDEYFALPLASRIQTVLEKKVAFFKDGQEVDAKEALARVRAARVAKGA
jgi:hypothetical protein